jgi:hypothetical protein
MPWCIAISEDIASKTTNFVLKVTIWGGRIVSTFYLNPLPACLDIHQGFLI